MQHGFRAEHSCENQVLLTTEDLVQNYEDKIQTDFIVLDFSKAFDVVPHQSCSLGGSAPFLLHSRTSLM